MIQFNCGEVVAEVPALGAESLILSTLHELSDYRFMHREPAQLDNNGGLTAGAADAVRFVIPT